MLEIMMSGGKNTYFPNSGPGGKVLLKGDTSAGYFGAVSEEDLIPMSTLREKAALTTGNALNSGTHVWHKFIRDNKILYISQRMIWYGLLSWNQLYNTGMLYGTKGIGLFPVGAGVEQFTPFPVKDRTDNKQWVVVPRLMQAADTDPGLTALQNTEQFLLLRQLSTNPPSALKPSWADLDPVRYLDEDFAGWSRETYEGNTGWSYSTKAVGGSTILLKTGGTATTTCWRPVLDLYSPEGIILGVENIQGQFSGIRPPQFRQKVDIIGTPITEISGIGWFTSKATPVALHGTIIEE